PNRFVVGHEELSLAMQVVAQRLLGHAVHEAYAFRRVPMAIDRRMATELELEVIAVSFHSPRAGLENEVRAARYSASLRFMAVDSGRMCPFGANPGPSWLTPPN